MSPETRLDIEFELGQLKLIATKLASISPSQTSLSEHETAFVAVQIHSFYNGIERVLIMLTAWQETTGDWHASLLRQFLNDPSFPTQISEN